MKKYLLILIIVFLTLFFVGWSFGVVFALPSFEVYLIGQNPWPEIIDVSAIEVDTNINITATITDVVGVYSTFVTIKNSDSVTMDSDSMSGSDDIYTAEFDISSYESGAYDVYISATDYLGNSTPTPLAILDSFTIDLITPWLSDWSYRKKITISNTNVDFDLTDFPLYVKISDEPDIDTHASSNGFDIRFTDFDGVTLLPYEREFWSGGAGSAVTADFWVKVPTVEDKDSTATDIYIYYGNFGVDDGSDTVNVWDSDYKGVWHSKNATDTTITDSTLNGNTGTKKAVDEPIEIIDGKIDKAQNYDGLDDYISVGNYNFVNGLGATFSSWYKSNYTGTNQMLFGGDGGIFCYSYYGGNLLCATNGSSSGNPSFGGNTHDGNWHHLVLTTNGTDAIAYIDGELKTSWSETMTTTTHQYAIGRYHRVLTGNYYSFNGQIDEVRVSDTARSADWVKFEYYNISSVTNELDWQSQEVSPEGPQNCSTDSVSGATICVAISNIENSGTMTDFDVSSNNVDAGTEVVLTALLLEVDGQIVTFTDETVSVEIGTAIIASGVATISYTPISVDGPHNLKASYAGDAIHQPSYKTAILTVSNPDRCQGSQGATICVDISTYMPWLTGWSHRKKITIQNIYADSDLTDFPVYIKISADSDMSTALDSGNDIRFTSSDKTTLLKYEKESWSGGAGSAVTADFWVKVPTLAADVGTDIYIYYGNFGVDDGQDIANVWDSSFKGAWHMPNGTILSALDSTSNNKDGAITGATASSLGLIDGASSFNGAFTPQIQMPAISTITTGTPFVLSAWVNPQTTGSYRTIMGWNYYHRLLIANSGQMLSQQNGNFYSEAAGDVPNDTWTFVVYWNDGTKERWYINGQLSGSEHIIGNAEWNAIFKIGQYDNVSYPYKGLIDEVRISNTARSADWIKFEYHNISEADNELTWWSQE